MTNAELRSRATWSLALPIAGGLIAALAVVDFAAKVGEREVAYVAAALCGAFICAAFGAAGLRLALGTRRILSRHDARPRGSWKAAAAAGLVASAVVLVEGSLLLLAGTAMAVTGA